MEFIKPNIVYSSSLSVGQNDGFAHKVGLGLVEFGKDGACSRFGDWHDVARIGCGKCGVAYESVQLVANARQQDVPWNLTPEPVLPSLQITEADR
jgi:hypothetical protein